MCFGTNRAQVEKEEYAMPHDVKDRASLFDLVDRFILISWKCPFPNEPRPEKTGFLHMRKQRRRSASR